MELSLDVNKGWVYGATGKLIAGITVKSNPKENVAIKLTNIPTLPEGDELMVSLVVKKNETILAFKEAGFIENVAQFIFDLDTIEIRDAFTLEKEIEAELEILVTNQSGSPIYLSQTIGIVIVKALFANENLPHTARPNWEIQYEQICEIGTQVASDRVIVMEAKDDVVNAEKAAKEAAKQASESSTAAALVEKSVSELETEARQSALSADESSKAAKLTLNAVIEQRITVDLQSQAVSDNLDLVVIKTAEALQHANSSFTSAGEALVFRNQAQTLAVRAETAEQSTALLKEDVVNLKSVLDQLETRVTGLAQAAENAATDAVGFAQVAGESKADAETARDQAKTYGEAAGIDANGNQTIEGNQRVKGISTHDQVINAIVGVSCPKPTIGDAATNRDYVNGFASKLNTIFYISDTSATGCRIVGGDWCLINFWSDRQDYADVYYTKLPSWMGAGWYMNAFTLAIPITHNLDGERPLKYVYCSNPLPNSAYTNIEDVEIEPTSRNDREIYIQLIDKGQKDCDNQDTIFQSELEYLVRVTRGAEVTEKRGTTPSLCWGGGGLGASRFAGVVIASSHDNNQAPRSAVWLVVEMGGRKRAAVKLCEFPHTIDYGALNMYSRYYAAKPSQGARALSLATKSADLTISTEDYDYYESITVRDLSK